MENMSIDTYIAKNISKTCLNYTNRTNLAKPGYLLIELLIATLIVSGVAVLVLRHQWGIISTQQNSLRRSKGIDYAIGWLQDLSEKPIISTFLQKEIENYTLTARINKIKQTHHISESVTGYVDDFVTIILDVAWHDVSGNKRNFTITTG